MSITPFLHVRSFDMVEGGMVGPNPYEYVEEARHRFHKSDKVGAKNRDMIFQWDLGFLLGKVVRYDDGY